MKLSDLEGQARDILQRYEYPKAAMLPLLWLVQQNQGYICPEAEAWVGRLLGVSIAHVREVVSFYNMFHTKPVGRRELRVCTSLPCVLRGAEDLLDRIKENLNIGPGETTPGQRSHPDGGRVPVRLRDGAHGPTRRALRRPSPG